MIVGVNTSEDADISNVKISEILIRRKLKVSWATMFVPGLVGPLAINDKLLRWLNRLIFLYFLMLSFNCFCC